jgi:hypothetical protein
MSIHRNQIEPMLSREQTFEDLRGKIEGVTAEFN